MRKTVLTVLSVLIVLSLVISGCAPAPTPTPAPKPTAAPKATEAPKAAATQAPTTAAAKAFLVGLCTDTGGINDKTFNQTSWKGVQDAMSKLGVQGKYLESKQQTDYAKNLTELLQSKSDMIVTVGFLLGEDTAKFAKDNPKVPFTIVDFSYDPPIPNVLGLTFATDQAAFMAGYLAAGVSKSGKVGTFGGMEIPTVSIFMAGYANGVAYYNKIHSTNVQVLGTKTYVGNFNSTDDGRRTGESLMDEGADVIMPVAGQVGLGTAAAVKERGKMLIGVDTDMYVSAPEYKGILLTSVLKNMDVAVFDAIKQAQAGTFKGGNYVGTLANNGIGLADYHDLKDKVPADLQKEVAQLKADLISGKVTTGWGTASKPADQPAAPAANANILGQKVTITLWHVQPPDDWRGKLLAEMIQDFMKQYPEITVDASYQGNYTDLDKKVKAAIAANTPPDAAAAYPSAVSDYLKANAVVALDDYMNDPKLGLSKDDSADLFAGYLAECRFPQYGNKYYAFPFTKSAVGMWYNLDLIKAAGFSAPPKTWKEFEEQCLAITQKTGKKGYAYYVDASTWNAWLYSRGATELNADQTQAVFNGPEAIEAIDMMSRLIKAGAAYAPEGANADQAAFGKGEAAFTMSSTSGTSYYQKAVKDGGATIKEWGQTNIPQSDPAKAKTVMYGGSFTVFKTTDIKQKAAWLFVKWFAETPQTVKWATGSGPLAPSGYMPVRASAAAKMADFFSKNPIQKQQIEQIVPYGAPEPSVRGQQEIRTVIAQAITSAFEGVKTSKQALDEAVKQANDILAKGRQ